jgi:CRISPR/Cas system type I-B associated protein Csh2 (Cas7 group RAMP superfamily)
MLQMKKELHFFSKNSPEAQTLFPPKQSMLMVELLLFKHSSLMKKLSKHKLKEELEEKVKMVCII